MHLVSVHVGMTKLKITSFRRQQLTQHFFDSGRRIRNHPRNDTGMHVWMRPLFSEQGSLLKIVQCFLLFMVLVVGSGSPETQPIPEQSLA